MIEMSGALREYDRRDYHSHDTCDDLNISRDVAFYLQNFLDSLEIFVDVSFPAQSSTLEVRDSPQDTVIGEHAQKKSIMGGITTLHC